MNELEKVKRQLAIAMAALKEISQWDDMLEDYWRDPSSRAEDAINGIKHLNNKHL